jgi:hypothetical protein
MNLVGVGPYIFLYIYPLSMLVIILRNKNVLFYIRGDLNKMFMSMSVGPFCDLAQDVDSQNWTQGAVVSLVMDENERECKYRHGQSGLDPGSSRLPSHGRERERM